MKRTSIVLAVLALVTGVSTLQAAPKKIIGYAECDGRPSVRQGSSDGGTVFGDWYENISSVSVSGSGVSVSIGQRKNGAQNGLDGHGMVGSIDLTFSASASAAPGNRTVTLRWSDGGTQTFTMKVLGVARVTSVDVPTLALGFTSVRVTLRGENLANPNSVTTTFAGNDFEPVVTAGGAPNPGISERIVSSSNTTVVVELLFAAPMEQAPVNFRLAGQFCTGYVPQLTHRVILKAAQPSSPFITRITMPTQPGGVNIGSVATFEITLNKPAPAGLQLAAVGGAGSSTGTGSATSPRIQPPNIDPRRIQDIARRIQGGTVIHWRLASPEIASAVPGDVSYNPGAVLNQMTVPAGEQIKRFNLKIERMPSSAGRTASVVLQTWIGNTNKFTAPEYFEFRFNVTDPNR